MRQTATVSKRRVGDRIIGMRIGVLRYPVRTTDGLAHYEMVFLDALAEAAAENPRDESSVW